MTNVMSTYWNIAPSFTIFSEFSPKWLFPVPILKDWSDGKGFGFNDAVIVIWKAPKKWRNIRQKA